MVCNVTIIEFGGNKIFEEQESMTASTTQRPGFILKYAGNTNTILEDTMCVAQRIVRFSEKTEEATISTFHGFLNLRLGGQFLSQQGIQLPNLARRR